MSPGPPSTRRRPATLRDVAAGAGVHVSTASRALNDGSTRRLSAETIARVKAVAAELRYTPDLVATGLRRGRTATVAVLVPDLGEPGVVPVLQGICGELDQWDRAALVRETFDDPERRAGALSDLVRRRVDAIVDCAALLGEGDLAEVSTRETMPLVLAVRDVPTEAVAGAIYDEDRAGTLAAEHLLGLGHRRVAQLHGPEGAEPSLRRAAGFSRTILSAGAEELTRSAAVRSQTAEEGERVTLELLRHAEPTALFVPGDELAVGAIRALGGRGLRCPEDVSIVGLGDRGLAALLATPLTTVRLPDRELGRVAGSLAIAMIEGEGPRRIALAPTLVARRSTTRPASAAL